MVRSPGYRFHWQDLGDIEGGRPNLGTEMHVAVYRLMQYTLREVLADRWSMEVASEVLREAGRRAGAEFCGNALDRSLPLEKFLAQVQEKLLALKVGLVRLEDSDFDALRFTLTVSEDLDCSGLPCTDETVCEYDEGFIAGIFEAYTGQPFDVREVDCWASGGRVCRFRVECRE